MDSGGLWWTLVASGGLWWPLVASGTDSPITGTDGARAPCGSSWQSAEGGFVEVHCKQGTDVIVGATVVASGAGNIINEVTLAIQANVGLGVIARVIHPYPTTAEGIMQAGLGYIRKHWSKLG